MVTRSILRPVLRPVTRAVSDTIRGFNPRSLFASGEQGIWLDPSDFSTLFQDSAGTTPVTAVGQPVGKILDKSGRGNHASQTTSASRPTVEARVNLATATEGAAATWNILAQVVDAGTPISGFSTSLQFGDNATARTAYKTVPMVAGVTYTASVFIEMDDGLAPSPSTLTSSGDFRLICAGTGAGGILQTTLVSGAIYRVSATITASSTANLNCGVTKATSQSSRTFRIAGIQVEEGTAATTYQRVNTATDYVDVGAPRYLQLDGTDDGMATPSINFTGTNKMTVWAGVRKLSDAAAAAFVELSASANTNSGAFVLFTPLSGGNIVMRHRGSSAFIEATGTPYAAPVTAVISASSVLVTGSVAVNVNKTPFTSTGVTGGGNYGNYPLYIGRRNNASLPFNGRLYQLIVRGAESNAGQIAAGEAWCNSKTRAY